MKSVYSEMLKIKGKYIKERLYTSKYWYFAKIVKMA